MRVLFLTAAVVFALDQATKWGVVRGLNLYELGEMDVVPPLLNFRMAWNQGINFGFLANGTELARWLLIALALGISSWVLWWLHREKAGVLSMIAGGLLIGGALGNVLDRLIYGAVADFITMTCCGFENPYSFNIADVAIFVGALGLVLFTGKHKRNPPPKPRKTP
jgi:signal peptidase II